MQSELTVKNLVHDALTTRIRACTLCEGALPLGVNPVIQTHPNAKLLIVGQAPGIRVHESGIPFNDPSGDRLKTWLGLDSQTFYNAQHVAIIPMGFCYPGTGKSGDFPPRKICANTWRESLLKTLTAVELTLVIGRYAIDWHLPGNEKNTISTVIQSLRGQETNTLVLPHPSPRNNPWLKNNPWFEIEVLPYIKKRIESLIDS